MFSVKFSLIVNHPVSKGSPFILKPFKVEFFFQGFPVFLLISEGNQNLLSIANSDKREVLTCPAWI